MDDRKDWPLYEIFIRARSGLDHKHVGSLHATDARKEGETEMRLYMLNAWRESTFYTPRERAALAWTESLTLIAATGAPDKDYELVKSEFNDAEQVNLTLLIGAINAWNRLAIGFRLAHPKEGGRAAA